MLEGIENVHGAVLDPILIARENTPAYLAVIEILAFLVELSALRVETLDDSSGYRTFLSQPYRAANDENVCFIDFLVQLWPVVFVPTLLCHVRPHSCGDVIVNGSQHFCCDLVFLHDHHGESHESFRMGECR